MQRKISDPIVYRFCKAIIKIAKSGGIDLSLMIEELTRYQGEFSGASSDVADTKQITPVDVRFLAAILGYWRTEADYTSAKGEPVALAKSGTDHSFEMLFRLSVSRFGDASNNLGLDETVDLLLQYGAIVENGDGKYVLVKDDLSVASEAIVLINYASELAETLAHNIDSPDRRFHKIARSNQFPLRKLPLLNQLMRDQAMDFLRFIDNTMESEEESERTGDDQTVRVGAGMYLIVEE